MAALKSESPSTEAKTASKMHRRSRSGCFTCRLRRKKCEEGKPACKACTHLGLTCNYKRPMWWSNGEQRRQQKEMIKNVIKQTQLTKKAQQAQQSHTGMSTPPELCHSVQSVPTTAEIFTDSIPHTRQGSVDSPFSGIADFNQFPQDGFFQLPAHPHQLANHPQFSAFRHMRSTSRLSDQFCERYSDATRLDYLNIQHVPAASRHIERTRRAIDFNFFDFQHGQMSPNHESLIEVDDCDKYLLNHFLDKVIKLIFPVLDANQHGSVRMDVVVPALESNKAYLHSCLSIAATHMKATQGLMSEQIDNDIIRHRYAAITELCEALNNQNSDRNSILEATLGMIFFQCSVGRAKEALPDIPWHQHFQAASDLVNTLQLPGSLIEAVDEKKTSMPPTFNMTLTSWIDILGATMLGRAPIYADTYRELNVRSASAGLAELMGCDDRIMYLISEIACLDMQKSDGLTEEALCSYVSLIAKEIGELEPTDEDIQNCFSTTGAIRPKQLRTNLTAIFALAARIYLCALVPGNDPGSLSMRHVTNRFTWAMNYIPEGPEGFDRCLAWPLLIAGANAAPETPFRAMFAERCAKLGEAAEFGSFGRVRELLHDIWAINDANAAQGELRGVHWRDVMQSKDWDFLLI
ncbi:hypothetical protein AMS68_006805 [Peltaster fructicola]|uniref:Zn(2)-C6 fungal-type domain-containing protein n=1 Tax=Peltaster fructicola TaxID=286661 RepID=A0A6H0Y366_9PEZI|nr:hypothetical protein AMS68_006805 [Peltaster fructicola]